MTRPEQDGAHLLAPLRTAGPESPSGVDVRRALRVGRRRARIRHAAIGAGGTGAVVAAVASVGVFLHVLAPSDPRPAAPGEDGFDVLHRAFRVGSAGGFTPDTYETGRYRQRIVLRAADPRDDTGTDAVVVMYAKGRTPQSAGAPGRPSGRPALPVDGHRALLLTAPVIRPGATELAWEWRPGAWGFVSLKGPGADVGRAEKVALSVRTGANDAVTRPVTVPAHALGAHDRLVGVVSSIGPARFGRVLVLRFAADDAAADTTTRIDVGVRLPVPERHATATIGGRPAVVSGRRSSSWTAAASPSRPVTPPRWRGSAAARDCATWPRRCASRPSRPGRPSPMPGVAQAGRRRPHPRPRRRHVDGHAVHRPDRHRDGDSGSGASPSVAHSGLTKRHAPDSPTASLPGTDARPPALGRDRRTSDARAPRRSPARDRRSTTRPRRHDRASSDPGLRDPPRPGRRLNPPALAT